MSQPSLSDSGRSSAAFSPQVLEDAHRKLRHISTADLSELRSKHVQLLHEVSSRHGLTDAALKDIEG